MSVEVFSTYDDTGEFVRVCEGSEEIKSIQQTLIAQEAGLIWDYKAQADEYYDIAANEIKTKQAMNLSIPAGNAQADGTTVYQITGLPAECAVQLVTPEGDRGSRYITDGSLELTFDTPGRYMIFLRSAPYFMEEITIHAD